MSDFLNKLVARNLNKVDSLQPRPVSMFEPQAFGDILPGTGYLFSKTVRDDELEDDQKDHKREADRDKMRQPSVPSQHEFAPSLPPGLKPRQSRDRGTKTELRQKALIRADALKDDKSPPERHIQPTPILPVKELQPKPRDQNHENQGTTDSEDPRTKASRPIERPKVDMSDYKHLNSSPTNESLETSSAKEQFKKLPNQQARKNPETPLKRSGNGIFKQTNIEEQDRPTPGLLIRETVIEKTVAPDVPVSIEGREVGPGMIPRPATIEIKGKSAAKPKAPTPHSSESPEIETKILIKPQVTQYREPPAYSPFKLKESLKTSPTIQVTIGRVEVRATQTQKPKQVQKKANPTGVMSLDEYLKQHEQRR